MAGGSASLDGAPANQIVAIVYTNYRGERAERLILPERLWFGSTDWHPDPQWFLDAVDLGRRQVRSFAVRDIERFSVPAAGAHVPNGQATPSTAS